MEGEYEVMDATDRDPAAFLSGLPSQILSESLAGSALLEHGYHNHLNGLPMLSTMQVEQDHHFGPQFNGQSSNHMSHGSRIRLGLAFDGGGLSANDASGSSGKFSDVGLHESVTSGSLANFMGNQSNLPLSDQEISLEMMGVLLSKGCSNPSNDDMNSSKSWDSTTTTNYLIQPEDFSWRTSVPGFDQQIQFGDDICLDEWTAPPMASNLCSDHHQAYDSSARLNSELSLSLATCGPTAVCGTTNIQGQCSDMSCCSVSHHSQFESGLNSDQNCPHSNSREQLSLSFPNSAGNSTTQVILGSRYLHVIEEILSEIASYSLESVSLLSYPNNVGSRSKHPGDGVHEVAPVEPPRQRKEIEAKKSQLLALLQMVDDQYNQCVDEIHTVTSAFHAATELDPQTHVRFSLQTISSLYKNLRERISTQILRLGSQEVDNGSSTSTGAIISDQRSSLEKSFIQRQWTIQQLKKREQQLWRPQRGLPERSVSVLRAWMFQNFLHPYPKDAEKHLLAIKSGLTRSQVSNWFINARVRLWKPLIEEMDAEVNRRNKVRTNKEGTDNSRRNQTTVYYPRFEMNDNM